MWKRFLFILFFCLCLWTFLTATQFLDFLTSFHKSRYSIKKMSGKNQSVIKATIFANELLLCSKLFRVKRPIGYKGQFWLKLKYKKVWFYSPDLCFNLRYYKSEQLTICFQAFTVQYCWYEWNEDEEGLLLLFFLLFWEKEIQTSSRGRMSVQSRFRRQRNGRSFVGLGRSMYAIPIQFEGR